MDCNFYEFNQYHLNVFKDSCYSEYKELADLAGKYGGLCEIICNYILANNLLGKSQSGTNLLEKNITSENLKKNNFVKTHLVKVYSVFRKIIALFFYIYPDNILSFFDQWRLVKKNSEGDRVINKKILKKIAGKTEEGGTLKFESFQREYFFDLSGHSMLIKKVSENEFTFFDPDKGEKRNMTLDQLGEEIDPYVGVKNRICFINSSKFLKRIGKVISRKNNQ